MVRVIIDGHVADVPEHTTILDAAASVGVNIPTLCYLKDVNEIGACRACVVEIEGIDQLVAACNNTVLDGMIVRTNSPKVRIARKANVEMLLSTHDSECTSCVRSGNCTLQTVANDLGITNLPYKKHLPNQDWPQDFPLIRNNNKCINCLRCIQICDKVQATGIWDLTNRATHTSVGVAGNRAIEVTDCALCGQCVTHCPTGALRERDDTDRVFAALADPKKTTILQIAPAVRTAWGEGVGLTHEEATVGRMVATMRQIGFDYVFDTDFAADLTIMEEGSELLARVKDPSVGPLPMFTSCCPGWVRFLKSHYPELTANLSTAKSPHQMFGATLKTYWAEKIGVDPHDVFVVSIMPCLAKKAEVAEPNQNDACGDPDVDVSLTVREMDRMIRAEHLDPRSLHEEPFDDPLGVATGAGHIFGATGGVMDAALRSAHFLLTGSNPDPDAFTAVRGLDGWKEATFDLGGTPVRVAVASGLANTQALIEALKAGEVAYDFIEIMACPGGCAGGGGQPIHDGCEMADMRGQILWDMDKAMDVRFSHENPSIELVYKEYFGEPLSERAHHLLHTDHFGWEMPLAPGVKA